MLECCPVDNYDNILRHILYRMKRLKQILILLIPLIFYTTIVVLLFGKALFPSDRELIFGDDVNHQYWFYRQFIIQSLKSGQIPFWNPYNFGGMPFLFNPIPNMWYPGSWLFLIFPLNFAYSLHFAVHILIACLGMYLFVRIFVPKTPALISGLAFGLSGFFVARVWAGHSDLIAAGSWMPWVVRAFFVSIEKCKLQITNPPAGRASYKLQKGITQLFQIIQNAIPTSFLLALQLIAGYQTMAFFTGMILGVIALVYFIVKKRIDPFIELFFVLLFSGGLAAIQLLPLYENLANSVRTMKLTYAWVSSGAETWKSLHMLFNPFVFGDKLSYFGVPPNYHEHAAFVGRTAVLLGCVSILFILYWIVNLLISKFSKRITKVRVPPLFVIGFAVFLILLIFSLWVSMAMNAPYDILKVLWEIVPIYKSLRFPSRHFFITVFALSGLAGLGVSVIKKPIIQIGIVCILSIELVWFGRQFIVLKPVPETRIDPKLVTYLQKDTILNRWLPNFGVWIQPRDSLDFPASMQYKIFSASGYDVAVPRNYYEFADVIDTKPYDNNILETDVQIPVLDVYNPYMDFLNIKYITVPFAYDPLQFDSSGRFIKVDEDNMRGWRLYQNRDVAPRYFLVSSVSVSSNRDTIKDLIRKRQLDLRKTVLFEKSEISKTSSNITSFEKNCIGKGNGTVSVKDYKLNSVLLSVYAPCDMVLVSSETNYPGWMASVDGKKTKILEGNLAFRTIIIPKGEHSVMMWYVPFIWYIGILTSLSTFFCIVILDYHQRKSRIVT
jgi:hypothetical protein